MANPRRVSATVDRLIDHGSDVFSVWLKTEQPIVKFRPGQFLHLALDPYIAESGYWPESRVFSIASAPGAAALRIVYSVKGTYTRRMSRELAVGRTVWLKYPYGDFVVDMKNGQGKKILIAGGTGISPFIALLCCANPTSVPLWLYYGVRNLDLVIFHEELQTAIKKDDLTLEVSIEEPCREIPSNLISRAGKLDIDSIYTRHGSEKSTHYYLSGPPGMIDAFTRHLSSNGVSPRNVHVDAWE